MTVISIVSCHLLDLRNRPTWCINLDEDDMKDDNNNIEHKKKTVRQEIKIIDYSSNKHRVLD